MFNSSCSPENGRSVMVLTLFALAVTSFSSALAENFALDRKVTFNTEPNYALSKDSKDLIQLTDGINVEGDGIFWADEKSVTWQREPMVLLTIDLEESRPIGKVSFSTAARNASHVGWPRSIGIFISEDGLKWHYATDIVADEHLRGTIPAISDETKLYRHDFISNDIGKKARYVALAASGAPYLTVDEIKVEDHAGEVFPLPLSGGVDHMEGIISYANRHYLASAIADRIRADRQALYQQIDKSKLPASERKLLLEKINALKADSEFPQTERFRAVLPFNKEHRSLFAIQGEFWRSLGFDKPVVRSIHRFDWQPIIHSLQDSKKSASVDIVLLKGESRSAALLISNPTGNELKFSVETNLPTAFSEGFAVFESIWTDTHQRRPVLDALVPLSKPIGTFTIPAGMSIKLWLTSDSSRVTSGDYKGDLLLSTANWEQKIPIHIQVSKTSLANSRPLLGMWDYALGPRYGVTAANQKAAIDFMRKEGVNIAWIPRDLLPWPKDGAATDNASYDFSSLIQKIKDVWPDAAAYAFYFLDSQQFGDTKLGTEAFNKAIAKFLKEMEEAFSSAGISSDKLYILTIDEPLDETKAKLSAAWSRAIKASGSKVRIFTDPIWKDFSSLPKEYIELADVVSPNIQYLQSTGDQALKYFSNLRSGGKPLWFYICSGPTRLADPTGYYRMAFWFTQLHGGTGIGFWSFSDIGGALDSWNDYSAGNTAYSPVFLGSNGVTRSIHWQAILEGMEDYRYFETLSRLAEERPEHRKEIESILNRAKSELSRIPNSLGGALINSGFWYDSVSGESAEQVRLDALSLIEELSSN